MIDNCFRCDERYELQNNINEGKVAFELVTVDSKWTRLSESDAAAKQDTQTRSRAHLFFLGLRCSAHGFYGLVDVYC